MEENVLETCVLEPLEGEKNDIIIFLASIKRSQDNLGQHIKDLSFPQREPQDRMEERIGVI